MRGLKCDIRANRLINYVAAPHTGAWIEITLCKSGDRFAIIPLYMSAWIEIHIVPHRCVDRTNRKEKKRVKEQSQYFYARIVGDRALFTNPATKGGGEKFSYPVPTRQALEGMVDNIYYKPTIVNVVDEVKVVNPIETESHGIRALLSNYKADLNYMIYVRKVEYLVKFHFEWNFARGDLTKDRHMGKHTELMTRSLEVGGRRDAFLGTRECYATIEPLTKEEYQTATTAYDGETLDFGIMFHTFTYPKTEKMPLIAHYTRTQMVNGVITYKSKSDCEIRNEITGYQYKTPSLQIRSVDDELAEYETYQ